MSLLSLAFVFGATAQAADAPRPEDFPQAENSAPYDEFLSKPRYINFRIDPVAPFFNFDLFLKQWGARVDIAITKDITLGPAIQGGPSYKQGDSYAYVHKLGITGGYYLNGTRLTEGIRRLKALFRRAGRPSGPLAGLAEDIRT